MPRRREAVVFGPYPPIPGPAAEATLADVRRLLAEGSDVQVISPERSAAHDDADLRRPAGVVRFARRAVGADRLVLHLDADLLTSKANRSELPARLAMAAALRSSRHSTVRVPGGVSLSTAWSRTLAAADELLVGDRLEADGAAAAPAEHAPSSAVPPEPHEAWNLPPEPTREELEAEIRRRATERRSGPAGAGGAQPGHRTAGRTIRAMPLLDSEPLPSGRRAVDVVKRVVGRLTNWRVNPVIERVNVLHQALLESFDPDDPQAGGAGRG